MKNVKKFIQLVISFSICASISIQAKTPAFPEAQGFGAFTQGGRGGEVFIVTTTADYGADEAVISGSLREAVESAMPRTVVFEVSGIIELKRPLKIEHPYITIAGQTAPGDGISLKDYSFTIAADESIVRYLRVRVGDVYRLETDAIEIGTVVDNTGQTEDIPSSNVIVDHVSAGWSTDEVFTIGTERATVQWSIIAECLYKSFHPKGGHSMGSIIRGSHGGISMLHNIYAHNNSRNPKLGSGGVSPGAVFDVRNNVFYNWGSTPGYSNNDEHVRINLVGNYYKPGPTTYNNDTIAYRVGGILNSIYATGNYHTNNADAVTDNWLLIKSAEGPINKQSKPFPYPPMKSRTGEAIYDLVLNGAGAVLPARDPVDQRIINEIRAGTGAMINSPQDVGGWPVYQSTKAPVDQDRDGMADEWEAAHGLSATDPGDHRYDADDDGYTNLEEYLNGTDPNAATTSLQDYAEFKAALDEIERLNVQGYAEANAYEAARLEALSGLPEPEVQVSFSERPEAMQKNLTVTLNDSVKIDMVLVEPGTFMMGSPESEPGRFADETQHQVTISKPYYLAATELTNEQYYAFMTKAYEKKYKSPVKSNSKPVALTWFNAVKYTEILSLNSGYKFRLPTEAEWEYACRAGTTTANFTGEAITREYANFSTREPGLKSSTIEVAKTLPNPWGFYDMPGNMAEWCSDILADYPVGPVADPAGPSLDAAKGITMASRRVRRGGEAGTFWEFIRSAARYGYKPKVNNGARIVLEVDKPQPFLKADTVGATWQISKGMDFANHQYTDVAVYNANGSMALFKDKEQNYYVSRNLSSSPERIDFKGEPKGKVIWDSKRPEILYYLTRDEDHSYIWSFNVNTDNVEMIYKSENFFSEISPAHPDDDHLLFGAKDKDESVLEVYSISKNESIKIPVEIPMHRIRFTKSPDLTIFINRSAEPKTSWLVDPNEKKVTQIFQGKSTSPSWRLGGENFCFYGNDVDGERKLLVLNTDGAIIKAFPELTNHHLGWSMDGEFIVTDAEASKGGACGGWICVVNYETGEIHRVVKHQSDFDKPDGSKNSTGHPHPQLSPDVTKVIYNSSRLGIDNPQVFVSVVRLPELVQNAGINKVGENVEVSWSKATGLEIENYLVFRKYKDGKVELSSTVEKETTSLTENVNSEIVEYHIVAREYSGLKSKPVVLKVD